MEKAAGFDLCSACDSVVLARGYALITNLQIHLPPGCYGRIAQRSSVSLRHHIDVGAGVVDTDYRGEVALVLSSHHVKAFIVSCGERIAQFN
jgi:dUTP pyrophosphatase